MVVGGEEYIIGKDLVEIKISAKDGFTVAMESNLFPILDTTITKELIDEGLARELISKVQQLRKQNDFEMMDHIKIFIRSDEEVQSAIGIHRDYVMAETLALELNQTEEELEEFDLNGHKTGIKVEII